MLSNSTHYYIILLVTNNMTLLEYYAVVCVFKYKLAHARVLVRETLRVRMCSLMNICVHLGHMCFC